MAPHTGQRPAAGRGLKRKAPTSNATGKGVGMADPGRLQGKAAKAGKTKPSRPGGPGEEGRAVEDGKGKGKVKVKVKVKVKSDIDDIFAGVKRLKDEKAEEEAERVAKKKKMKEEHKRRQANPFTGEGGPERRWAWADEVKPVRFDDEGLPIYTWDSLRIGQGGGTASCPFDCDCCF